MQVVEEVLNEAARSGVYLYVEEGKLKFKADQHSMSDALLTKLKMHKEAIIEALLIAQNANEQAAGPEPIVAQERVGNLQFPLSFSQQRMWFLNRFMGPNAVYNMPLALRFRGVESAEALCAALEDLRARHESLRTRFELRDEEVVQTIAETLEAIRVERVESEQQVAMLASQERFFSF